MYPTAAELVAESSNAALQALGEAQQEELFEGAVFAVEEYTGQKFNLEVGLTRRLDGNGTGTIYLPKRLESIDTLEVNGSALTADEVELSDDRDRIMVKQIGSMAFGYYEQTMWDIDGRPPRTFVFGEGSVTITGNWGWSEFPTAVRSAIRRDMEDTASADANFLSETVQQFRRIGLRDVSQGNLRASITGASGLSPVVIRLLQPYVWTGPIGTVI